MRATDPAMDLPPLLLSAWYPTLFALSNNWYVLDRPRIGLLLLAVTGAALASYALVAASQAILARVARGSPTFTHAHARGTGRAILALSCAGLLFGLLQGTLLTVMGATATAITFMLGLALCAVLFVRGRQKFYTVLLLFLSILSVLAWTAGVVRSRAQISDAVGKLPEVAAWPDFRFSERPNLWLIIYDAYTSRAAYSEEFNFDNAAQYRYLEESGFKVVDAYSNYQATWPTTLSLFLGAHHYYQLISGVDDSSAGRAIMAGLAPNPVLQTLRANGYRVQYLHGMEYFTSERGIVDFVYPHASFRSALDIFQSPVISSVAKRISSGRQGGLRAQERMLRERMPAAAGGDVPWFSFVHIAVPGHAPLRQDWRELASFEEIFRTRTRAANRHMRALLDDIRARDPGAVVIVLGDHGAWRWRGAWTLDADPNRSFELAGIDSGTVTQDLFGIMLAVGSQGRCDAWIDPGLTPVNLMRSVFACLSGRAPGSLRREGDYSLSGGKRKFITQRNGHPLARWEPAPMR